MLTLTKIIACALLTGSAIAVHAADGALDPAFGTGGKVQLSPGSVRAGALNFVATDIAVQSSGKIVIGGYDDQGDCVVSRLNVDGSLDTGFGGKNGFPPGFVGYSGCAYDGIAVRPDDRIVAVAHGVAQSDVVFAMQFSADGDADNAFTNYGTGIVDILAVAGDSIYLSRVVIDSDGTIDVAGTYHQQSTNDNQFLFLRISADGTSVEPLFQYEFGSGDNQDDHALDLAIDSQGRYVVGGYHRGAAGNYDCAIIRITRDLYDVDHSFGTGGQTIVPFDLGGDNGDFCTALAVVKPSDYIVLGGYATATAGSGTYQAAILAFIGNNGNLAEHNCASVCEPDRLAFAYDNNPSAGTSNTITKLVVDYYDTQFPQVLAIGSGFQTGAPNGVMFGIARVNLPASANFSLDTAFNGSGSLGVYFAERFDGGVFTTSNAGLSGAFANGKLVAAGSSTISPGGNAAAVTRLAAFDGVFKSGFETPYY